ncbi:hypothetical protein AUEXF2481DRAFT_7754 [Aureobasidium subglaciale EXF-2481]|uniref:Uncharacterized protein n=1 Tax=Aureobasidium subglaciale (strain EXF-2481) TaxID=1043005 RepID=A0A074Y3I5_AURSE|nr:uncharacterized protein AUEXF2481DRAFT_7754 [Aureobasidium subglaciale EXF-2481]KAI5202179.1 hypothetical protein E4T38_05702 [Aureobasidium subglaciale]KAI5221138.1 hypothetical protein E4T40_05660 [Aureobasidium subglaciale]KAI5224361.1 hypothetical protein E4T41_05681 [Aureobasidium subglaciale]KAI5260982.1 hypothetical protein E4T46_05456 [Aureobasidium subglaciale]KEQ92358.1 hypothetical protein AUEXF2481DRAFT_7754 [Aureobasidium subglaciale EXF-2481]
MSQSVSPRGQNNNIPNQYATYQPRQIPYSAHFENALHHILEYPPRSRDGIFIIPNDSSEQPKQGVSVRARDVDPTSLPQVTLQHLPLSIHDPRRIFASPVPGIRLTHPGGYLEGGPGPSPEDQRSWARDFVAREGVVGQEGLGMAVQHHMQQNMALAKERMRARYDAQQQNARVEKEIKTLMDQREMEVKIETRMKEDAKRRRENREHKRKIPAV